MICMTVALIKLGCFKLNFIWYSCTWSGGMQWCLAAKHERYSSTQIQITQYEMRRQCEQFKDPFSSSIASSSQEMSVIKCICWNKHFSCSLILILSRHSVSSSHFQQRLGAKWDILQIRANFVTISFLHKKS